MGHVHARVVVYLNLWQHYVKAGRPSATPITKRGADEIETGGVADEVAADTSSSSYDANGESGADDEDEEDLNSIEDLSHDGEQVTLERVFFPYLVGRG